MLQYDRRQFIQRASFGAAMFSTPGLFADQLSLTPRQTEGPFYPDKLPLDTDNDLLVINDSTTPAVGQVVHLTGRIFSQSWEPVRNAVVEIWQADSTGVYIHSQAPNHENLDKNFQGFGRFLTDSKGRYYFRAIKPVHYGTRTPHIHVAVNKGSQRMLTTECYVKGDPMNARDPILNRIPDPKDREMLIVDFKPLPGSKIGELTANFDMVIGTTPEDRNDDRGRQGPRGGQRRRPR